MVVSDKTLASECCRVAYLVILDTILLIHVVRALQLTEKKNKKATKSGKRRRRFLHDGAFYTTARLRSQARLALDTVQSPFLIGGVFRWFLHLFRSSATFPLYYGIQTTTTILT